MLHHPRRAAAAPSVVPPPHRLAARALVVVLAALPALPAGSALARGNRPAPLAALPASLAAPPASLAAPSSRLSPAVPSATPAPAPPLRYERLALRHRDGRPFIAHVTRVDLCRPGVTLRATAPDEGPSLTSAWARRVGAIAALNGDFFDVPVRGGPARPLGPARGASRDFPPRALYYFGAIVAMRPGAPPDIRDGFALEPRDTDAISTQERLVIAGQLTLSPDVRHSIRRHPRSALGLTRDRRTLLLVTVDGRTARSSGVTTPELGVLLRDLGAWEGVRMDGGGSATHYVAARGGVVNTPSDGRERPVANHLGILFDPTVTTPPAFCASPSP